MTRYYLMGSGKMRNIEKKSEHFCKNCLVHYWGLEHICQLDKKREVKDGTKREGLR